MIRHLGLLTAAALALAVAAPVASAEELKSYTYIEAVTSPAYKGLERFAEEIEKATDGAITMKPNVGGSLPISATDITLAVADGVLDVADDQFFSGNFETAGLLRLPFLMPTRDDYLKGREIWNEVAKPQFEALGVRFLADYHYPEQVIFSAKPITKLEDIRGMRIRVGSPEQGALIERLGGIPTTITPADVPTALQSGVVDAVLTASAGGGLVWREFFTHNYRLPINWVNCVFIVNQDVYDGLSPEHQEALQKSADTAAAFIETTLLNSDESSTQSFIDTGMIVTIPTDEELATAKAAIQDYWTEWASGKGDVTRDALDRIMAAVAGD